MDYYRTSLGTSAMEDCFELHQHLWRTSLARNVHRDQPPSTCYTLNKEGPLSLLNNKQLAALATPPAFMAWSRLSCLTHHKCCWGLQLLALGEPTLKPRIDLTGVSHGFWKVQPIKTSREADAINHYGNTSFVPHARLGCRFA